MKFTKIVCTIGLKTEKKEYLSALVDAGMNMMRLNFSHGDFEEHGARIKILREIMKEKGKHIAILVDTPGPEIRTGKLKEDSVELEKWQNFVLTPEEIIWDKHRVFMTYENLYQDVKIGDMIFVNDGMIHLKVESIKNKDVICYVEKAGVLTAKRWINLPGIEVNLPALTEDDKKDMLWGCEQGVDFVAASFIRKKSDVEEVRSVLNSHGGENIKIISKIENQEGLDNFDEILEVSDGIMVARGDLWVEIPMEELPIVQKMMVEKTVQASKFVITATQMLDSMMKNPRPTRAEVTDVANAVLDGTDAVMLSGETSKHNCAYPVEAVQTMAMICERADREMTGPRFDVSLAHVDGEHEVTEAIAKGVVETAKIVDAKLIVCISSSGKTAHKIRKYFPSQYILVLTTVEKTAKQLSLLKGTRVELLDDCATLDSCSAKLMSFVKEMWLVAGDKFLLTASSGDQGQWKTDMLKIVVVE